MQQLVLAATTQPQAAYCAFTKSLQSEWKFLQSVVPECGCMYTDLEEIISNDFLQALFGSEITPEERLLFSLPARMGGLNIKNPVITSPISYLTSREAAGLLVNAIKGMEIFQPEAHNENVQLSIRNKKIKNQEKDKRTFDGILPQFSPSLQRAILRARDSLSAWLTMPPL